MIKPTAKQDIITVYSKGKLLDMSPNKAVKKFASKPYYAFIVKHEVKDLALQRMGIIFSLEKNIQGEIPFQGGMVTVDKQFAVRKYELGKFKGFESSGITTTMEGRWSALFWRINNAQKAIFSEYNPNEDYNEERRVQWPLRKKEKYKREIAFW